MTTFQKWLDRIDNLLEVQKFSGEDTISASFTRRELIELKMMIGVASENGEEESSSGKPNNCEDAISRQAVIDILRYECSDKVERYLRDKIDALPSVTPKQETVTEFADRCRECGSMIGRQMKQKTGHWIDDTSLGYHVSICSNCGWRGHGDTCLIYKPKFCPNCGAKMDESGGTE